MFSIILSFCISPCICYYIFEKNDTERNTDENVISSDSIMFTEFSNDTFPNEFECEFESFGHKFVYKFELSTVNAASRNNIFIDNPLNKSAVTKFESEIKTEYKFYKSNEDAIATLILNQDLNQQNISSQYKYRALITIIYHSSGHEYDIIPLIIDKTTKNKRKRDKSKKSISHRYLVSRRQNFYNEDFNNENWKDKRKRRSLTQLNVDYLLVTDFSVLLKQQRVLNTNNRDIVLSYMRIFYSQLTYAVNQRFINSLDGDPDFSIRITLANFYFLTSPVSWTDPNVVGDTNNPKYNGKDVLVSTKTLDAFASYMNFLSFPFDYDHAVAFFDKDLWNDVSTDSPASRSQVIGMAYIGAICTAFKYSICEDLGFNSITLASHELAHNLGAQHDGTPPAADCPASDAYIMTPTIGLYKTNLQNLFKFSNCTIKQFKSNLLPNSPKCLLNTLINQTQLNSKIDEIAYLPGKLWDADFQCKLATGIYKSLSTVCKQLNICMQLWCSDADHINCISIPGWGAIDGTTCDTNKICIKGDCVVDNYTNSNVIYSCKPNPCLNSGVCTQISQFYVCTCQNGFYGFKCEYKYNSTMYNQTTDTSLNVSYKLSTNWVLMNIIFSLIILVTLI